MDAIAKWGSTIIVLINTLFGIVALFFLAAGCLVKYAAEKVDDIAGKAISAAKDKLPVDASKYIDLDNLKVSEFVGEAYVAFVAVGAVLLCIVIWAYCGTCCKSKWMLTVYALILTLIILGQVAVVILLTTNKTLIDDAIKDTLSESLTLYKGGRAKDAPSRAWSAIMGLLNCCGINGYEDFKTLDGWERHVTVDTSVNVNKNVTLEAPYMCCVNASSPCPDITYNTTNVYHGGCYDALWDLIESNKTMAIGIISGLGAFEIIMWFLTVWLIKELGSKNKKVAPE